MRNEKSASVWLYDCLDFLVAPPEYLWSTKDPIMLANGGMGIQRMYVDTWLEVIEKEKALGTGHLGPTGVGNMPRPMERGGCDCEVCSGNQAILEARGAG